MADKEVAPLEIRPPTEAQTVACLQLLTSNYDRPIQESQVAAFLNERRATSGALDGLRGAYRGEQLLAATLLRPQAGGLGFVWPPRWQGENGGNAARLLLKSVVDDPPFADLTMLQVVLDVANDACAPVLQECGFHLAAELLYLYCDTLEPPDEPNEGLLTYEPWIESKEPDFARLIEATYERTKDCPELNGVRSTQDVLESYRATGVYDSSKWFVVSNQWVEAGCLLLADHPAQNQLELVYLGLLRNARGRGWGLELVRKAQRVAFEAGRERLVLAVDARNEPALRHYGAAGFREWDRKVVYLRFQRG